MPPLVLDLIKVVMNHLMWVLGTELRPPVRAVPALS